MKFEDLKFKKPDSFPNLQERAIHFFPNNYGIRVDVSSDPVKSSSAYEIQILRKITENTYAEDSFNGLYSTIPDTNFVPISEINVLLEQLESLCPAPLKGKPKFKLGDKVQFITKNLEGRIETKNGEIKIIDERGTFENPFNVSYDILGEDDIFYKHIGENFICE